MTLLLFLHIAGSVLFLGNIITAAFWKVRADVRGDAAEIHRTVNNVMLADYAFTLPGLLLLIVTGSLMAAKGGYSLAGLNWLTASLILFGITGVLWLAVLIPLQRGMIRLSRQALENGAVTSAYKKLSAYWAVFGILATLLPLFILYFMVSKPF
ncbi:DUF2269 domain-containing protein [Paenibacillus sp. Y412MC10]|uniref:DUF2269 domain-containing protein n=1 Tax=Geobacillus sp. (strain Y412MC10) TaxID=481743 RepID=UPI0011AB4A23|nr:DUF2269 domain-containing protein [Paenibacillus sp. Y412MC10]